MQMYDESEGLPPGGSQESLFPDVAESHYQVFQVKLAHHMINIYTEMCGNLF